MGCNVKSRNSMMDRSKIILSFGFISLSTAIIIATTYPATGYEASIYSATPNSVWLLLVMALAAGISKAWSRRSSIRNLALSLLIGSVLTVVYLPYIRGYQYLGEYDSLSQLGWARSLKQGTVGAIDLFYPILHSISVSLNIIIDLPLSQSLLLSLFIFATVYVLGIMIFVRYLSPQNTSGITVISAISGILFLPIVLIRVPVLQPIPATVSILFFPVVLYLCLRSFESQSWQWQTLFFIGMISLLFLHPQQTFNLSAIILSTYIWKMISSQIEQNPTYSYSPTGLQLFFASVILIGWILTQPAFVRLVTHILGVLASPGSLDASAAGGGDGGQPDVNLPLILAKIFTISTIYLILASSYSLKSLITVGRSALSNNWSNVSTTQYRVSVLTVSTAALVFLSFLFIISGRTNQIFRYIGLCLVFITIIGSISVYELQEHLSKRIGQSKAKKGLQISLLILLLISIPIIHPSAYISKPTDQVSDHQLSGYEAAFEYTDDETPITTLYSPADRYRDAILGRQENRFGIGAAPSNAVLVDESPPVFNSSENISKPYYMVITKPDRYYAIHQYQEQQYTRSQFESVHSNRNVSRIYSNGEFNLSLIRDVSPST